MNDEVKEILIDLIGYYNVIGTDDDPGFGPFADVVHRASKALERHAKGIGEGTQNNNSADVDPFKAYDEYPDEIIKLEDEW
jgi:hypothetical protein